MKYVLGICNLVAIVLLGYIMNLCFSSNIASETAYQAMVNKYKTENAAQVCYITNLYHYGDWTTILGDTLAIQNGLTPSDGARAYSVGKIGTALSFEETCVSYIIAFGEGITAVMEPYTVYDDGVRILTVALDLNSGTYIVKMPTYTTTLNIDTREELISIFTQLNAGNIAANSERQYDALCHARANSINKIIARSMGLSGYRTTDMVYIPAHDNTIPGINTIKEQTILVLQGTNALTSNSTTLAGYTRVEKRQLCVVQKQVGGAFVRFYCYSDNIPTGATIVELVETKQEAQAMSVGPYYQVH